MQDVYVRLAKHLENLVMGYPFNDALLELLKEMFSPTEAQVALAIPNSIPPLAVVDTGTIAARSELPESTVEEALQSLSARNLLYTAATESGAVGYGLLQVGYGVPQTFFWGGQQDDHAKRMARLILNYFTVPTTQKIYGGVSTKTYKYSPTGLAVDVSPQGVLPFEGMAPIVGAATKIGLAHCPCRLSAKILGRTDCQHSLEVCIKYDEMAEQVISKGLAREISKDEALHVLRKCEEEGLVHMVDNAEGQIKHTCNCCGHYCWNVGIINRRKIPRDVLMAVYFIRETVTEECIGCGACVDICPVSAVSVLDNKAEVDSDWCIGCGVCAVTCPTEAVTLRRRSNNRPPKDFAELHKRIRVERGLD